MPFAAPSRRSARGFRALLGLAAVALLCTLDGPLVAGDPDVQTPENPSQTPAVTYASLDAAACQDELTRRGVAFQAVDTARGLGSRIVLIDGLQLSRLMIRYNVGCRDEDVLHLKKVDEDFFEG